MLMSVEEGSAKLPEGISELRSCRVPRNQTFQNPLIKDYTLKHNRDPIIF